MITFHFIFWPLLCLLLIFGIPHIRKYRIRKKDWRETNNELFLEYGLNVQIPWKWWCKNVKYGNYMDMEYSPKRYSLELAKKYWIKQLT